MRYFLRAIVVCVALVAGLAPAWAVATSLMITGPVGTTLQNTCTSSGIGATVDVISNEPTGTSDNFTITAPGFSGYTWTGENGPFSGPSTYGFGSPTSWGINVAADTLIAGTILVYDQPDLGGSVVYKSAITWNCTTGAVASIVNTDLAIPAPIPALNPWLLAGLACLLLGAGMVAARGRRK